MSTLWEVRNELSDLINTYKGEGVDAIDSELYNRLNQIDDKFLDALLAYDRSTSLAAQLKESK